MATGPRTNLLRRTTSATFGEQIHLVGGFKHQGPLLLVDVDQVVAPRQADERFQVLVAQRLDVREKGFLEDLPGRGILRNVFGEVTTFCLHTLDDGVGPRTQIRRVGPFVVQTLFEEIEHDARAALVRLKVVKDGLRVLLEIFKGTCTATHGRGGGSARREGSARPVRQARQHAGEGRDRVGAHSWCSQSKTKAVVEYKSGSGVRKVRN